MEGIIPERNFGIGIFRRIRPFNWYFGLFVNKKIVNSWTFFPALMKIVYNVE